MAAFLYAGRFDAYVYEDHYTVELKSGLSVDIDAE